ncbi:hypothetical protein RJ640_023471 [Escallonia rubra]|uniref:Glycosyltransferase 61 catalytic domain-containing protein n=1 Tax=Escallonia rubra TaxID=112253 RepID=A0AA88RLG7_9ASTE|nr:hypothetical protein RJ640_023471 [Escallonia rubra]
MEGGLKACNRNKSPCHSIKFITCLFLLLFSVLILFHIQASPYGSSSSPSSASWAFFHQWNHQANLSTTTETLVTKLRDSITFLPLKDLRYADTAMTGNTWFMSSLNDTQEANEAEYLYFPSKESKGRLLCIKGRDFHDGTKNSYALAWPESLPDSATLMEGVTFVCDTYYNYQNLWHGLCAMAPFVRWSMKNECLKPTRWVLFHWGELNVKMGSWLQHLMLANFGETKIEVFERGNEPYCFAKAVAMRHDLESMGQENKLKVFDLLRCKAKKFCGLNPAGRGKEINKRGVPTIRLTLLMRRGSRSFKNVTVVANIFAKECAKVDGCILNFVQSEDLSFCDQVKEMTYTDIVVSPHGAQLTNMLFMDRGSSIMEFFPKGWLEHAGLGQYAHHWMANQAGMRHEGAWWDPIGKECPFPKDELQCFLFYKDGKVGHNETFFAEWSRKVLGQVRKSKLEQASKNVVTTSNTCVC